MTPRFLITNSVPLNGGDESLLRAVVESLRLRYPMCDVTVLCSDVARSRQQLPDLQLATDLEFAANRTERAEISRLYRVADMVLPAPGGYLHDHYAIDDRLRGFEVALALGKPVVLLPQSIGPFWKPESIRRVRDVLNRVARICVRDNASREHLLACGVHAGRIQLTSDAAFLWRRLAPELYNPKRAEPIRRIGLCFRAWPLGDLPTTEQTIGKAVQLCSHLLADEERELVFLSTCQGIPDYVDDSLLAIKVVDRLPPTLRQRCVIDRKRYAPRELIQQLGRCDAFIGMRLHACILAMLGGTPAMGLGYEEKTAEIFTQLGLADYQSSFKADGAEWIQRTDRFLADATGILTSLDAALQEQAEGAATTFGIIDEHLRLTARSTRPAEANSEWVGLVSHYGVAHLRLQQVAALVRELRPKQMLDIGCATGHLRTLCPGVEYIGCDFVPPAEAVDFPFYQLDFNRQPLPADLLDLELVTCSGILEYIEDVPAFLAIIRDRLRPNGHLVATYFNMNHVSRIVALLRGRSFPVRRDWRGFHSPSELSQLISEAGFQVKRTVAMNHSFGTAAGVSQPVTTELSLPRVRPWSRFLSHQFLFVAACDARRRRPTLVEELNSLIPDGARFMLVDNNEWALDGLGGRVAIPFLERDGKYWGRPADDETGIAELERLRNAGASHIAFGAPAFWWLEHYTGLNRYLRSHFHCVVHNERLIVFNLQEESSGTPARRTA